MKIQILSLAALSALAAIGCSDGDVDRVERVTVGSDSAAIESIAGDKSQVARVLARAHARGTFDDALAEALKDSAMAHEVAALIDADPRFAAAAAPAQSTATRAKASAATKPAARAARSTSSTSTTASRGDALDRTEAEAKRVNERLEQAARVKREAEQAKRTVDDIFGRR